MNLRIYKYNNYYNRLVKIMNTNSPEYGDYLYELERANFNPNDEIYTEHTFGSATNLYYGEGDYLVVTNDTNEIVSRWFIIENERQRGGQWKIQLRRDVIVDFYNIIINAPCFIEKATLEQSDPMIFNSEDMSFNQIKRGEILLENNLKTPWIVAYLSRYHTNEETEELTYNTFTGSFKNNSEGIADEIYASLSDYPLYNLRTQGTNTLVYESNDYLTFTAVYQITGDASRVHFLNVSNKGSVYGNSSDVNSYPNPPTASAEVNISNPKSKYETLYNIYKTYYEVDSFGLKKNSLTGWYSYDSYLKMLEENNKIIQAGDKYYQVTVRGYKTIQYGMEYLLDNSSPLGTKTIELLVTPYLNTNGKNIYVQMEPCGDSFVRTNIEIKIEEIVVSANEVSYNFGYSSAVTTDAEYEVIATPLRNVSFDTGNGTSFNHIGSYGLQWFQALANKYYSSTGVYDLQIVPYISIDNLDITEEISSGRAIYCTEDEGRIKRAIGFKLKTSSFTSIKSISLDLQEDKKIGSLTELYRFTSPNGIGNFDFDPYKNDGLQYYEIDCTLKPISPYIKINPFFNEGSFYGDDYNDFRGLICGGDFSLSITSNAWQTYANNNKYFQDVFDRQIENLNVQNNVTRERERWQVVTGAASGAAAGALLGTGMGSGVVGGIAGGALSLYAGLKDVSLNQTLRNEALDYAQDQFGYSLQTIKARSDSLTRTTSYNINNKYFPYIEIFKCTDEEIQALKDKIRYNGMTVMRIGKIINYIKEEPSYIKGQIIRLDHPEFYGDFHMAKEIASEVFKGVFI